MNRFRSGLVPLFAVAALLSCSSEPTGDLRGDLAELVATPSQLFIELGQTKLVRVGGVDAQGNPLDFNYEVTSAGSGISVRRDSSYLPIFMDDSTLQAPATAATFQFIVEGDAYTQTSFTVSAGGLDVVVPVQVVPQSGLAATFSNAAPALGEVVTLTAPSGITFNLDATLDIGGNPVTIVSQDASSIAFIPPPSVNSPVTVNGVVSAAAPDVVFSPATDTPLVTPLIDTVDVTYSTTAPTLGQSVTLTSPNPLIQLVVDSLIFPGQLPGREGDAQNILVAVDSQSLTFDAPPNIDGSGTVVNFHFPGDYLIPLPTRPTVTGQNIGLFLAATISDLNPDVSETVTITAPAGFTFDPAAAVQVGASAAIVVANNGASLGIVPLPGSAGVPQIDGVVPDACAVEHPDHAGWRRRRYGAGRSPDAGWNGRSCHSAGYRRASGRGGYGDLRPAGFRGRRSIHYYELTAGCGNILDHYGLERRWRCRHGSLLAHLRRSIRGRPRLPGVINSTEAAHVGG